MVGISGLTVAYLGAHQNVYAATTSSPQPSVVNDVSISHNPESATSLNSMAHFGIEFAPISEDQTMSANSQNTSLSSSAGFVKTENDAIQVAQQWIQSFNATEINVVPVQASRLLGPNKYASLDSNTAEGDSHIVNGQFKDIPAYDIALENIKVPNTLPGSTTSTKSVTLHVVVDATSGKVLEVFDVFQAQ
jgi:hypothetical protein